MPTKKTKKLDLLDGEWVEFFKPTEEDYLEFQKELKDAGGEIASARIKELLLPFIASWSFSCPISVESMSKEIDFENLQAMLYAFFSMGRPREDLLKKFGLL